MRLSIFSILAGLLVLSWAQGVRAQQWRGDPVVVQALNIQVTDPYANGFDWPGLVRALIGIEHGDELTGARLEQSQKALESLAQVQAGVILSPQGALVTIAVQPYKRIKSIDIDGSYPLFDSDVLKVMTMAKGDVFRPRAIQDQAGLIAQRYREEGYIDPQVRITWKQDRTDGHYAVSVEIDKGPVYILSRVKITGNHHQPDVVLMRLMRTWRRPAVWIGTGRFVEADLKADMDKLTAYYRSQGYTEVRIDGEISRDPGRRQAQVVITINEGPHYTVAFSGNRFFSEAALRRELAIFVSGNRGNTGLRRGILNIRRRYLEAGFADVRVSRCATDADSVAPDHKAVRIEIEEGLRHIVDRVHIEGNQRIDADDIRAQMLTRPASGLSGGVYVAAVLQEDVAAVRALYQKDGFLNIRVTEDAAVDDRTQKVAVTLTIDEGIQTLVGRVTVEGPSPLAAGGLLAATQLKPGTAFRPYAVADDENAVAAQIAALGYPHVLVQAKVALGSDQSRADIVFHIDTGPYVVLGRVFWAGNFRTRQTLLNRQLDIEENAPFSLAAVLAAQRKLRDLDLFQSVQVRTIGLKEKASKVHLLVTMAEKPSYFFELGGGYQTDKAFYGRTQVGDRNFWGTGKKIRLSGEQSGIGYRWEAGASEPHVFGSPMSADVDFYKERREEFNQDFGTDSTGGTLTLARPLVRKVTATLGLRYERRQQYLRERDASSTAVDPETLEPRAFLVTTPAIRWDTRDSFIQPREGGLAGLSVDISRGLEGSVDNFIKYQLDLRGYGSPYHKLVLAGRAFAGYIQPYGVDGQIPEDQLFFLGGTNDVRGFAENKLLFDADQDPVGGRLALVGSLEARYTLVGNWELTLFVDAGNLQKTLDDRIGDGWRWAAGLGLRYETPIGPIGLLYGHKLNPRPGESSGQYHISIGYTF